tara:strand:- start:4702 stop:5598 length:897 start_codon:yes stop_codon:yes gene_type:complete
MKSKKKVVKKVKPKFSPLFLQLLQKKDTEAASLLSDREATYLVQSYYTVQDDRKRFNSQCIALKKDKKPHDLILWFSENAKKLEDQIKKVLDTYSNSQEIGQWCRKITGIGPVIASGLISNIDMTRAETAGHIWSFAGLNPKQVWKKGEKRPWNPELKTLCWKIGTSFIRTNSDKPNIYRDLYYQRKEYEESLNNAGKLKEQAFARRDQFKSWGKTKSEAYKYYCKGVLPPGHIDARARRWAVKIFISHYFEAAYKLTYKKEAPIPHILTKEGHTHKIESPVPVTLLTKKKVHIGELS